MEANKEQLNTLQNKISEERARLSSDRMDISFGEIINMYKNQELIIRPEYQRLYRWNENQKTALIESILLGIPIPPIFVAEDDDGIWELVDGLQRISTIVSFYGELKEDLTKISFENEEDVDTEEDIESEEILKLINKWVLKAGGLVPSLEGFNVDTLPTKYVINIKRAVCRVEILRGESNIAMKYELFKRLNSGGSKLTPQEIRNAIYRGINPVVNDLLLELSKNPNFISLTGLSPKKKKELYDQELILRFIALLNNQSEVNDNLENYLNTFIEKAVRSEDFDKEYFESTFTQVLELLNQVGDNTTFRNERNQFVPAYFEGITIGIAQNFEKFTSEHEALKQKIEQLKTDEAFKRVSGSASNSKSRIKNRLNRSNEIFSS